MSKEVMLLELVLDKFSNIKEVLNGTNEIEQYLTKLKLSEEVNTTNNVFEKVKNLVESLYDHSVKVKDEFYKNYNKLESVLVDKAAHIENNDRIIEENIENNSNGIVKNVENSDSAVQENRSDSPSHVVEALDIQNTKDGESGSIISSDSCDRNHESDVENKSDESESDVDDRNHQTEVVDRDHETEVDDRNCETEVNGTDQELKVDQSNNNIATKRKRNVDDNFENEEDSATECNGIEEHKEGASSDGAEEINGTEIPNSVHDPLEITEESTDVIDTSILDDNSTRKDISVEKESLEEDKDKSCEDETEAKKEPKIWLVDLNKLIDPKPEKSVKFDSSVIILTSSDEESNTPKKSNVKEKNTELKSALKNSAKSHTEAGIKERKDEKQLTNEKSRESDSESEENETSSSDSEIKVVDKKKAKKIANVAKSKHSSDSHAKERHLKEKNKSVNDKTAKSKHHSRKEESSSDSEKSDDEPTTKRKKTSKYQEQSSDSSDCVIQEDSEPENRNKNESPEIISRRSSRLNNMKHRKQENKERLRNVFQRKLKRPLRSNFEGASKKSVDKSDSESDTDSSKKKKSSKLSQKKNNKLIEHLSDTSSLSDDENEDVELKKKSKKSNKTKSKDVFDDIEDKKFTQKVYISLPRIECERLKEVYMKNKEILEIKRLRNVNLPKSTKRSHKGKDESKSSSDTDKPKSKKTKNTASTKPTSDSEHSSNDDPLKNPSENNEDANEETDKAQKQTENADDRMAEIAMDEMKESDDDKKAEESCSESEEAKDKSKDTDDKKKKTEKKSEKKKAEEESKSSTDEDKKKTEDEASEDAETDDKKESDEDKKKAKKKWRSDKLLTAKIDSTDSEEEFSKFCKKKEKSREEIMRKTKKRAKKAVLSDSEDSAKGKNKNSDDSSDQSEDGSSSNSESEKEVAEKKKPVRRRIKRTKGSSSSSEEDKSTRKQIRRVIGKDALSETTKQAEAEEKERKARIAEKQKKYNQTYEGTADSKVEKVVLDYDKKGKKELLSLNKKIVKKLKPHQASGVQFMWDACFESLERAKTTKGSGCILAHCMGLGKTLQVIALSHTLLTNSEDTKINKILVVCPVNTVLNWKAEFKKWLPKDSEIEVYELVSCKRNYERQYCVKGWHSDGGVLIIGYAMFRNLSNPDNKRISKKMRTAFQEGLVDPGPDLVVCDEGHLLKNEKTNLSMAMNRIKTSRRIVLTGTPLQNNLKEYWCMVQFIKPNLLGTYKEYLNRFVNPIINGQYTDSTQHDILLMRKRSHVLHKLLDGVVQRRDYSVLEPYLPPKHEYVLFLKLTETQVKLYKHYMERFARQNDGSNRVSFLFTDFQELQRICTHPRVMLDKTNEKKEKEFVEDEDSEGSLKDFIDDGEATSSSSNNSSSKSSSDSEDSGSDKKEKNPKRRQQKTRVTRTLAAQRREKDEDSDPELIEITKEWWQEYCDGEELDNINNSGKLFLLFQILKECEDIGDKVLVFSQSLYTLNCIEYFLERIDEATQAGTPEKVCGHSGSWSKGLDYFRLDGSSSCDSRASWCDQFNNPDNVRARLFLISTKAGGLGINLVAANRVIIFDVSWNPSHDIQSIYRVYRFGQTKPCYIYRFVTYGTMEMKIYERQVTKQAISKRVIDEQQIDRHYNQNDLQELYTCDLEPTDRPIPLVPKDVLLAEMLQKYDTTIFKYHLHQSLLENKEDEGLNEDERKAAWEEFENEKVLRKNTSVNFFNNATMNAQTIAAALASIVRKDNPTWSEVQIRGIIPALVQQLQVQLSEGDMTMYTRVQQEMQLMQALQAQKLKEAYYQQQVMRMIQHQQQRAKMVGNLNVNPAQLVARPQGSVLNSYLSAPPRFGGPSSAPQRQLPSDVIELND